MNMIKNTVEIPKKIKDKFLARQIELQKDFASVFSTPAGKRVLKHLVDVCRNDNSDPLNPYAVMRKDGCLHLLEVYIPSMLKNNKR